MLVGKSPPGFDPTASLALVDRVHAIDHISPASSETDTLAVVRVGPHVATRDAACFGRLRENGEVRDEEERYRRHFDRPVDHFLAV
jgi:hypothetical protein